MKRTTLLMGNSSGFTLIEMVMVIIITGIVAATVSVLIRRPVEGYMNLSRRAELVDAADSALRMMARDIRAALPNSIRVSGGTALEMINTVDGGRYRIGPPGNASNRLEFNKADTDFDVMGGLNHIVAYSGTGLRIAIYNLGVTSADAYAGNVITPAGTTVNISSTGSDSHVQLTPGFQFAYESPRQRLYVVDGPISYFCDTATGSLLRNDGYAIGAVQPATPAGTPVTRHLTGCSITYLPGSSTRAALVTVALTLSASGESINLLRQVHVENIP